MKTYDISVAVETEKEYINFSNIKIFVRELLEKDKELKVIDICAEKGEDEQ